MENNKITSISALRKIMTKNSYENVFGSPTIEYYFKGVGAWIQKLGNKMARDKNKPYSVRYKGLGKNFKTLNECLQYILSGNYIQEAELVERACKDMSFHYNANV